MRNQFEWKFNFSNGQHSTKSVLHTPANFVAGSGSPVKLDSSTVLLPAVTTPSTGTRS